MANTWRIFRRELGSFFNSALAYTVIPVFLALVAVFTLWFDDIFLQGTVTLRPMFFWSAIFLIFLCPAVTMRSFAEERRTGTIEILLTLPVKDTEVILGKYLASLALVAVALFLTFPYAVTMSLSGHLDPGHVVGGYIGLLCLGGAFCAVGTAASAFTSNQIVSFISALVFCLVPFAAGFFLHRVPAGLLPIVQYLSFNYHFDALSRGVVDSRNIIFLGSMAAFCLHLTSFALRMKRLH